MGKQAAAKGDPTTGVTEGPPWRVIEVRPLSDSTLDVRFADGTRGEVDLATLVGDESAGVFASLRNPALFRQVRVDHGAVTWPGDIDLAPDAMYDDIRETGRSIPH